MQKNIFWAVTVTSVLACAQSASAAEVNDYNAQFRAQKAAIAAQSSGQWINGKQVADEEALEAEAQADHGTSVEDRPSRVNVSGFSRPSGGVLVPSAERVDSDGAE